MAAVAPRAKGGSRNCASRGVCSGAVCILMQAGTCACGEERLMFARRKLFTPVPLIVFALTAVPVQAHVTVQPRESTQGATEKYKMRVPNEKSVPTVRLEADFPTAADITSVEEKAGWKIELKRDSAGKIMGAIWSGSSIAPRDIVEFGFLARNPSDATEIVWKVVQIYEDGSRSEWTGPKGSRSPAPVTQLKPR